MPENTSVAPLQLQKVQLLRALFAAIAAVMIAFSGDHSALVGLRVFAGFAIANSLAWFIAAWLFFPKGYRAVPVALGVFSFFAGVAASANFISETWYFITVVSIWAGLTGVIELFWQASLRRDPRSKMWARDELSVGVMSLLLAIALLIVPHDYFYEYFVAKANQTFILSGDIIAVGIFGLYAAVLAVFLAISGFSPVPKEVAPDAASAADAPAENSVDPLAPEEARNG